MDIHLITVVAPKNENGKRSLLKFAWSMQINFW